MILCTSSFWGWAHGSTQRGTLTFSSSGENSSSRKGDLKTSSTAASHLSVLFPAAHVTQLPALSIVPKEKAWAQLFHQGHHRLIPISENPHNSKGSSETTGEVKQRICLRYLWFSLLFFFFYFPSSFNLPCFWKSGAKSNQLVFSQTSPQYAWSRSFCSCVELLGSEG